MTSSRPSATQYDAMCCIDKVLTTGTSVTWHNIFLDLRKFSGFWKDSWIVNYFWFSWRLLVDLRIKPGFKIVFSIWQSFQKRFFLKISILNIFGFAKYFWIVPFQLPYKRCKSNDWRIHTRVVLYPDISRPSGCTTFQLHGRIWGRDYYEGIPTPPLPKI